MKKITDSVDLELLKKKVLKARKLKRIQDALKRKKAVFGLPFYRPHYHQHKFHTNGDKKRRLAESGNRSGKSQMGVAEDCAWLLGERPWYKHSFDIYTRDPNAQEKRKVLRHEGSVNHPYVKKGIPPVPNKILVLVNDNDIINEVFTGKTGKVWEYLPEGFVTKKVKNNMGTTVALECENGSLLQFDTIKSYIINPQGHESKDWDAIHVDEPCPQDMWNANARGLLDRNGSAWFTLTPLREPWISEYFFPDDHDADNRPEEFFKDLELDNGELLKAYSYALRWSMDENPYNSAEAIQSYLSTLDEDEREARRLGIPLAFAGMVYREFDKGGRHILEEVPKGWKDFDQPPKDCVIFASIDTHPKTDFHCLLMAVDSNDNMFLYDEIRTINDATSFAKALLPKLAGKRVGWIKCEPAAWIEDPVHHDCIQRDFAKNGLYVTKAAKDLRQGVMKVKAVLREERGFYVSPWLSGFRKEIRNYMFDKNGKIKDKDDHYMECFYRLLYTIPKWFPKVKFDRNDFEEREFKGSGIFSNNEDYSLD